MKRIIILLAVCLLGTTAYAQNDGTEDPVEIISINGLELGGKYTREQIFAALGGEPDRIVQSEEDPGFFEYHYDKDVFFQMDDEFYGGSIITSRFYISKEIKIGDSIEKINNLKGICAAGGYNESFYAGGVRWKPTNQTTWDWQSVNFYYDSQGKIAEMYIYVYYY